MPFHPSPPPLFLIGVPAASSPPLLPFHFVFSDEPIVGGGQTCQQALECQKKI
jgi:hypothetical protein